MAEERVQKILAAAGLGSRRACEALIEDGRVKVNGQVIHLGDKADPQHDTIMVDGKIVRPPKEKIYIALNKPKGYLSDIDETHPKPTVLIWSAWMSPCFRRPAGFGKRRLSAANQ